MLSKQAQKEVDGLLTKIAGESSMMEHGYKPIRLRMIQAHNANATGADKGVRVGSLNFRAQSKLFHGAMKDFNEAFSTTRKKFGGNNQNNKRSAPSSEGENKNKKDKDNGLKTKKNKRSMKAIKPEAKEQNKESQGSSEAKKSKKNKELVIGQGKTPDLIRETSDDPNMSNDQKLKIWRAKRQELLAMHELAKPLIIQSENQNLIRKLD